MSIALPNDGYDYTFKGGTDDLETAIRLIKEMCNVHSYPYKGIVIDSRTGEVVFSAESKVGEQNGKRKTL